MIKEVVNPLPLQCNTKSKKRRETKKGKEGQKKKKTMVSFHVDVTNESMYIVFQTSSHNPRVNLHLKN